MGRPPAHSVDDLLDAAAALFADGGARALTMSAVARAAGAPSGSVYHRFADRPALMAALWLRTAQRFQNAYREVVGRAPTAATAIDAAAWIVDWCRDNLAEAVVLQAGARAFDPDEWAEPSRTELAALRDARAREIGDIVRRIAKQTGRSRAETAFALFDMPLAIARRSLVVGDAPPPEATKLVRSLGQRILLASTAAP